MTEEKRIWIAGSSSLASFEVTKETPKLYYIDRDTSKIEYGEYSFYWKKTIEKEHHPGMKERAFLTREEALDYLIQSAKARREYLSEQIRRCSNEISELIDLKNGADTTKDGK